MSIEIIDETPDPKVVRETVCTSCGVRLRYLKPDVTTETRKDYTGSSDDYYSIACPKCKEKLSVKAWY